MRRLLTSSLPLAAAALLVLSLAALSTAQEDKPAAKLKVLVVTGHDAGAHKWRETTPLVRKTLEDTGRFEVKVSEDAGIFESSTLSKYDAVLLNYGFWEAPELSSAARDGLLAYARSGKGVVSLHFSCSSYQAWDEYKELLGRVWKKGTGGHGPRGKFTVKVEAADHPITAGVSDFETDDELYAKLTGDAKIHVLCSAYSEWSKAVEPILFVKEYGAGRIVHNVLGHDVRARESESYKKLLVRGTEWAATGKVTLK
jgi:type 1 glutamine amidotransferase